MAGGWQPGRGESLAERTRLWGATGPDRDEPDRPLRPTTPGRHCWVVADGEALPGVLLEWRNGPVGWQGRVAYAVPGDGSARLVEEWLPSDRLKESET